MDSLGNSCSHKSQENRPLAELETEIAMEEVEKGFFEVELQSEEE